MFNLEQYKKIPLPTWLLLFSMLINAISTMVTLFMSLYLINALGFNMKQSGELVTFYGIGSVIGAYFGGKLSEKILPIKIAKVSLFTNAFFIAIVIFSKNYYYLLFDIFFIGLTNSAFIPVARMLLLQDCKPEQRYLLNNLRYVMNNLGVSMIFIGGFLIEISYTVFFLFNAGVTVIAALLLFAIPPRKIEKKETKVTFEQAPKKSIHYFILLSAIVFFVTLVFAQQKITYTIYLNHFYHMSSKWIGYIYLCNTIFIVTCQLPITQAIKNTNLFLITTVGGVILCLGFFITGLSTMTSLAFISCIIWTFGEMLFYPSIQTIIYEQAPENKKGKYLGIYQAIYSGANILGPFLGSRIYHYYHAQYVWYACGFLAVMVILINRLVEKNIFNK